MRSYPALESRTYPALDLTDLVIYIFQFLKQKLKSSIENQSQLVLLL